ncbi:hypothetical protein FVR03_14860 [Pontibacter qinzhouensis]|uniref:DUF4957 domain-containing protein n=1 Tax=Pontibacter qinzhouensis TaxID=2603253 RepID=A0A5C8JJQ5_9BACT|nr:hypothetical protein [Pontibacter qinzhouensis]TXK37682.1 hypothetical protein FVR03_14860 [Pontibacter qinzhouensis]
MKNKILVLNLVFASIIALAFNACKDPFNDITDEEQNRSFMAVFRQQANTGNANDPLASQVVNTNDVYLVWNGINGAAGYRLQMKTQAGAWDRPADILWDTVVGPDVLKLTKKDLQYSTRHNFAIQTLSPRGEAYHSKWYGLGDGAHNDERADFDTGERYGIPDVVSVSNVTENSLRVWFDQTVYDTNPTVLNPSFQHENDMFLIDEILVEPASVNRDLPSKKITLTPTDLANGYVDVTGLSSNALYVVNGLNNKVKRYWDRLYNTTMVRMRGQVGAPILIPHVVDNLNTWAKQHNASRLDTILNNFLFDNELAEGTIFMLEAGKNYYINSGTVIAKGFTLKSNSPGTKATVLLGLGYSESNTANAHTPNFQLGRQAQAGEIGSITVGDVIFDGINFESPYAVNFFNQSLFPGKAISGNYFMNQHSASMPFTCSKLEVRNCNFQGIVRGWFRTQGSNRQVIENIIVDNCLFHDNGMYDVNGRGYAFITGEARSERTNIFNNVVIKNNSFIGISYDQLMRENANLNWAPSVVWNVTIENNTFLNAFSISNGRFLIAHPNAPINSSYTIKKNLFISVKAANDNRPFFQSGLNFTAYRPGLRFDITDNYSTAAKSANGAVTYFTSAEIFNNQPFSHASRGAGFNGGELNVGGLEATRVITGLTPIAPENLMIDPYPKGRQTGTTWAPDSHIYNLNGMRFRNTSEVQNHPIFTKGIGDPRWR